MVIFPFILIFQLYIIPIYSLSSQKYLQIQNFEKVKIEKDTSFYQFQANEVFINSDLLINIENNLFLNNEINLTICLYNYEPDNEKGDSQCISVNDSNTLIFNTLPILTNIQSYYLVIYCKEYEQLYSIKNDENIEFFYFFISRPIQFINTNGYMFKFNENYSLKEYSQKYLEFKNPSYENDKILKIKIKLRNEKSENLFEIKDLATSESISYNSALYYGKIEKKKKI